MAKTNKYTSINFNHIHDKNISSNSKSSSTNNSNKNPSSSSSFASATYSSISSKTHGRMLVLTRPTPTPTPKPITTSPPILSPKPQPDPTTVSDPISLRPLGRTGAGGFVSSPLPIPEIPPVVNLHKPEKFVPPHLRAGFVGKEEKPVIRSGDRNQRQNGHLGSHGRYEDDRRPKSGGGYERMRKAGESDHGLMMDRPRSSGNRPSSS